MMAVGSMIRGRKDIVAIMSDYQSSLCIGVGHHRRHERSNFTMSDVEDLDDFDDFGEDGDDLDDFGDLELEEGEDFEGEAIDFDDNFDEPADAGPLEEEELGGAGGEDDAWRFDDTKLDDLEDFLKQAAVSVPRRRPKGGY